jgi:tetratricopeptide (TPR) repeat protein
LKKLIKNFGILIGSIIGITLIIGLIFIQTIRNPHIYLNIADSFIKTEKLGFAEFFTKKGIKINTIKNLLKVHNNLTMSGLEQQLNMEYGHLYSQYSWIKYKKRDLNEAENYIQKAIQYKKLSFQLSPIDWIRFGIINYEIGNKQVGWDNILKALLEDTNIENTDPAIIIAINHIVKEQIDSNISFDKYLEKIRYENAQMVPDLSIIISDTVKTSLHNFIGEIFVVTFFSPTCGSCRQELTNINKLFKNLSTRLIFILNQPQRTEQAYQLLKDLNYKNPTLAVLNQMNAYEIIKAEPTTWIISKQGKVIYKHVGYQRGDENIYLYEIEKLEKY